MPSIIKYDWVWTEYDLLLPFVAHCSTLIPSGAAGQLDMVLPSLTKFDANKRGSHTGRQQWRQPFGVEFWSPGFASFAFLLKHSQMVLIW